MNFTKLRVRTLAQRYEVTEAEALELWSERAAMREHEGRMSRADAEACALADVHVHYSSTRNVRKTDED